MVDLPDEQSNLAQGPDNFTAIFFNEVTSETREFTFTLQQYIQSRQWITCPAVESEIELAAWLRESNEHRQGAYCGVAVWKTELRAKNAQ
jgi:hypothetical protein